MKLASGWKIVKYWWFINVFFWWVNVTCIQIMQTRYSGITYLFIFSSLLYDVRTRDKFWCYENFEFSTIWPLNYFLRVLSVPRSSQVSFEYPTENVASPHINNPRYSCPFVAKFNHCYFLMFLFNLIHFVSLYKCVFTQSLGGGVYFRRSILVWASGSWPRCDWDLRWVGSSFTV